MADNEDQGAAFMALLRKHKVALGIGVAVLVLVAMASEDSSPPSADSPVIGTRGSDAPDGFDKRKWDEDQRRDDEQQRRRIDGIREVERCADEDGRIVEVPAGTCT